ncbi:Gfo/Idh/MocA family protein [Roseibium salinum]|uniref:Gfo/Idh/MocA family oxidoreductase n=1 Tax=Roseibium salinum TaxID=1604349 RepID=A0ABT3QXB2_9HYPH|nr:Gfo/Idh/MocA family oxidoreductase [Roseibium sp. DSM 29163]MCX2721579.1 Gfo/Idh/MocA family oxidoreductase [Roseibium sp. DSM 29163]
MKKGALIGCGFFAQNHMHAWAAVEGADMIALCDRDEGRLRETAERFGIERTYTDAAELFKAEQLDFADIATTVQTHLPLVELAAASGVNIICQKPFADTMEDARAMTAAARAAGVTLMVHENFRWQSPVRRVKAEVDSGALGTPFWGRVSFRSAYDVYSGQPYLATDERFIVQDLGIHILDVARFLFGDVATISASTKRVNPAIRAEDVATMMLVHKDGATSIVDCSYATRLPREHFPETLIEIDGSGGTLRLMADYQLVVHNAEGTHRNDVSPPLLPWAERPWHNIQESVLNIQQHFVECLNISSVPETSGADNLKTLELVEAAYRSAAEGSRSLTTGHEAR